MDGTQQLTLGLAVVGLLTLIVNTVYTIMTRNGSVDNSKKLETAAVKLTAVKNDLSQVHEKVNGTAEAREKKIETLEGRIDQLLLALAAKGNATAENSPPPAPPAKL